MSIESKRMAVVFDMLGPYHIARLNALGSVVTTLGVELSARSKVYDWNPMFAETTFERQTLFFGADSTEISTSKLAHRIGMTLDKWRPDVVFVPGWASRGAFASLRWALTNRIPAVVMSESTKEDAFRSPLKELFKRAMVGCFNAGFVGGSRSEAYLRELGMPPGAIAKGYNAVDNDFFAKGAAAARTERGLRARLGLPNRYLLASARFIPIKNLPNLLSAFARFLAMRPNSDQNLVLLGDGQERVAIEASRAKLGLEDRVLLPGFKQYAELPAYYGLADAFVHVSAVEPWGLVVNEAMSASLPIVVSRICGCADDLLQNGKNGFAVDHYDIDQIAQAFCQLEDAGTQQLAEMGASSREIVEIVSPQGFASGACTAAEIALHRRPVLPTVACRLLSSVVESRLHRYAGVR